MKKNKLDPRIMQQLAINFNCNNDPETLIVALEENQQSLHYIMTDLLDDFYNATLQGNRKEHLSSELKYLSNAIKENQNKKNIVEGLASNMHIKNPNAQEITKLLDKYTKNLIPKIVQMKNTLQYTTKLVKRTKFKILQTI